MTQITQALNVKIIYKLLSSSPDLSAELESSCKTWNRLMAGGQLLFLLRAAVSDTLSTAVNLQHWSIQQCGSRCPLCDSSHPTDALWL